MITNKNEAKALTEHISCDCKCKFNSAACNPKQKWNNKTCHCESKKYNKCKKDYSWSPSTCICENSKYLKSIAATSVTESDGVVVFMDIISRKKTNVTSTTSIIYHSKTVKDCYILHTVLLVIILLLIVTFIWYYYAKQKGTMKNRK